MKIVQTVQISAECPDCSKTISFSIKAADIDCASDGFDEAEWEMDDGEYVCQDCYARREAQRRQDDIEAGEWARQQDMEYKAWADGVARSVKIGR